MELLVRGKLLSQVPTHQGPILALVRSSDLISGVFANGLGSIPGRVIPKTQKMVLDAALP